MYVFINLVLTWVIRVIVASLTLKSNLNFRNQLMFKMILGRAEDVFLTA